MKKKQLALIYEVNNNQVEKIIKHIECTKSNVDIDDIYIFYDNLSEDNINKIKKNYKCNFIKNSKLKKAKFEMFRMLEKYKKIVYTNSESSITNGLLKKYNDGYCVKIYNNRFVESNFKYLLKKYNMLDFAQNYELLIITDKLDYEKIYKWCIRSSILLMPILRNRIDGILELMVQKYNIKPTIINENKSNIIESNKYLCEVNHKKKFIKKTGGPLVTVLMSVYDRDEYLDYAINSILNQSYENIEFLIVLEYSNMQEKIFEKIKKYNDKRIKVISNKKKLGLAESLNIGLKEAKGKYVARMDDDDISEFDRIEKQVEFLERNNDITVVGTYMKFFGTSNLICKLPAENQLLKVKCLYKTPLFHPTVMIRLNKLLENNFRYNNVYAEDYDLWSRIISKLEIANIETVLYNYRLSNENKSLQDEKKINESHNKIMSYQLNEYLNLKLSFDDLQLLSGRIDVLGNCVNLDKLYIKKIKIWQKIQYANKKIKFYNEISIKQELEEIKLYYAELKKSKI